MADREATEYAKYGANPPTVGDHRKVNGQIKVLHDTVVVQSGDEVDDKMFAFKIPSNAIILPSSTIHHEGLGTSCTLNLGDATTTDGLASLVDVSSAGAFAALENVAVDDYGKEVWEQLGYSEDPKELLDVFFTLKGATAGVDASIVHEIFYV